MFGFFCDCDWQLTPVTWKNVTPTEASFPTLPFHGSGFSEQPGMGLAQLEMFESETDCDMLCHIKNRCTYSYVMYVYL